MEYSTILYEPPPNTSIYCFFPIRLRVNDKVTSSTHSQPVMLDDHSDLDPPLPIPNRTVKRICANDSAATSVKVGYRQAVIPKNPPLPCSRGFFFGRLFYYLFPNVLTYCINIKSKGMT